jgi:hypothetical protein
MYPTRGFMNPRYNVIIPKIIKEKVLDFALNSGLSYFNINVDPREEAEKGKRRFAMLTEYPELEISQMIDAFKEIAYEEIGVPEILPEPQFGNFIGVNLEGGSVHEHQDSRDKNNNVHLRFNFMIQKPDIGGNPIINGKEYWIDEDTCWMNYASEWKHGSTPVAGGRARVVLSMGACVPEHIVREKISKKIGWEG